MNREASGPATASACAAGGGPTSTFGSTTIIDLHPLVGATRPVRVSGLLPALLAPRVAEGRELMVRLPLSAPSSPPRPVGQHVRRTQVARRILVVDDNVDAAELLAELLRASGHEVAVSHDPHAAIEVFEGFRPEVAILDIGLPDMDGYELASRVAETGALRDCRLIALTGYGQDRDRKRAADAGFAAHLTKPVKLDALLGAIAGSDPDHVS